MNRRRGRPKITPPSEREQVEARLARLEDAVAPIRDRRDRDDLVIRRPDDRTAQQLEAADMVARLRYLETRLKIGGTS